MHFHNHHFLHRLKPFAKIKYPQIESNAKVKTNKVLDLSQFAPNLPPRQVLKAKAHQTKWLVKLKKSQGCLAEVKHLVVLAPWK